MLKQLNVQTVSAKIVSLPDLAICVRKYDPLHQVASCLLSWLPSTTSKQPCFIIFFLIFMIYYKALSCKTIAWQVQCNEIVKWLSCYINFLVFYCSMGQVGRQPIVTIFVPQEISAYFLQIQICNNINVIMLGTFLKTNILFCLSVNLYIYFVLVIG
jgi:hypothetical protein